MNRAGFTLPVVLVIVGGLLILAVGILLLSTVERGTARAYSNREKARLAVRAGLEQLRVQLAAEAANDDFLILQSLPGTPVVSGREVAPHLFLARGQDAGTPAGSPLFRYVPLFSSAGSPADATLAAPGLTALLPAAGAQAAEFSTLPYLDKVRVAWIPIRDDQNRIVARYAYWVEDLQSRVDPAIAGNAKGSSGDHARVEWPFPAPGINDQAAAANQRSLDQIALFALDPAATQDQQRDLGKALLRNRKLLVSPGSALAAAEFSPPLNRLTAASTDGGVPGDLIDLRQRAVERGLSTGVRPYLEQPRVPFSAGMDPAATGDPKLNLNALLVKSRATAIDEMAAFIRRALPQFDSRKGGFPDDYVKTVAANILDYADADSEPSVGTGYRGVDAYPLVSEYVFRSSWLDVRTVGTRKFLDLSTTIFVELWNMTNLPVQGRAEVSYENNYSFQIPPNPNPVSLADLSTASHSLTRSDGHWWFPAFNVSLAPNEYRAYRCGTVSYSFDAVSAAEWIASPLILGGETYAERGSGYRMRWNGVLVDQARGGVHRNDSFLRFPTTAKEGRHVNRLTIPAHSHWRGFPSSRDNNMGDARMSHYLQSPQDANVYPQNYSPNRRNIREGTIYNGNNFQVYGRVLPSEWPDGGHDSPFGTANMSGLLGMTQTSFNDDHRIQPDDNRFFNQLPSLANGAEEAPTRISNRGRFFSITELGHAYDPVMWRVRAVNATLNNAGVSWGDVTSTSVSSTDHGGGNTLRIGRPEHPRFDVAGTRASHLMDLFHVGISRSDLAAEREGNTVNVEGQINLNTASKTALRQLVAGRLRQDPQMREFASNTHTQGTSRFPAVNALTNPPDCTRIANAIADAIIRLRPFAAVSEAAHARDPVAVGQPEVFGNPKLFSEYATADYPSLQWTDAAAEETFARVFDASTVRSRNFRVWLVGQAVSPIADPAAVPEVLSEVRRVVQIFADPGERASDGNIDPAKFKIQEFHESDF